MEKQEIFIPAITLEWSEWTEWDKINHDARINNGVKIPRKPGVYEV